MAVLVGSCFYAYGEEKRDLSQTERYKLYVVENLSPSRTGGAYIPIASTGANNNYILVDTLIGKTWILTNIGAPFKGEDGKENALGSYAWEPLFFKTEITPVWEQAWGKGALSVTPK